MSYTDQLREEEARQAAAPKREYLSNKEYSSLKAALTRAKNSDSPKKVLATVEKAVSRFDETTWPDDWSLWRIALEDASHDARQQGFNALSQELYAASLMLFRF